MDIVGDIGGTNARFAVAGEDGALGPTRTLAVKDHSRFEDAVVAFLAEEGITAPRAACFAIAAPLDGSDHVAMTNAPWQFSIRHMADQLGFKKVRVANDFEALSRFALSVTADDVVEIKPGEVIEGAPVVTVGPGTGLGTGFVVPTQERPLAIPAQGGHSVLAAATEDEATLLTIAHTVLGRPATGEDFLSGRGLKRLHDVMARRDGWQAPLETPEAITSAALEGDPTGVATIHQFCAFLGTVTAAAALSTGARAGVVLAGGILPRYPKLLIESPFAERFVGASAMVEYLDAIPVHLLGTGDAALKGAACLLRD